MDLVGLKEDSWNFLKVNTIIQSLIMIPLKNLKGLKEQSNLLKINTIIFLVFIYKITITNQKKDTPL